MSITSNKFTSELTLDVYDTDLQVVSAQQGDKLSRFVRISITANGEPMQFVSGLSATLEGHRADGQVVADKCKIEGNTIIVELTEAMLSVHGDGIYKIVFYGTDGSALSSVPFKVHVTKNPFDENEVIATPIFSALTDALNKVNKAIQDTEKVIEEATDKIDEMDKLKDDLSDMMDELEQAEKEREQAEKDRNQNVDDAIDRINDALDGVDDAIKNANDAADRANQAADDFDNLMNDKFEDVFVRKSEVGKPNGVASLDNNGKVPEEQLPELPDFENTFVKKSEIGKANGIASLDENGKVPEEQLPELDDGLCVFVSEDEPTDIKIGESWIKIIGTYNNGTIGNIYLAYILNHYLRNHDGTTTLGETENVICKNGETVTPITKNFDGYLAEKPSSVKIAGSSQVVDVYYDEQQYNILYVLSGGTNHSSNPSTIYYTEEVTLKNATKTYATFSGWYLDSAFANKITKLSKISKDTTVYAKWIETEYGITYILDGGTNASSNPNTITYYQTVNLADATKANHTFNGWYTDAGFTNKVTTLSNINSDITLYAKFTANAYTITYVLNGGTNNSSNPTSITSSQTVTLLDATKSGYTFDGWYTDSGFSNKITVLSGVTSNITLYAKFTETSSGGDSGGSGNGSGDIPTTGTVLLYNYGDECVDVTGGWVVWNDMSDENRIVSKNSDHLEFSSAGGRSYDGRCYDPHLRTVNNVIKNGVGGTIHMLYDIESYSLVSDDTRVTMDVTHDTNQSIIKHSYHSTSATNVTMSKDFIWYEDWKVAVGLSLYGELDTTINGEGGYVIPSGKLKVYKIWILYDDSGVITGGNGGSGGSSGGNTDSGDSGLGDSTGSNDGKTYLYNRGDECKNLTGGWSTIASGATVTINSDHLYMYMPMLDGSNTPYPSKCYTINSFSFSDLSKYTKLCIKYSFNGNTGSHKVMGFTDAELGIDTIGTEFISSLSTNTDLTYEMESSVNISDISDLFNPNKHLGTVLIPNAYSASTFKIHQIWLE